MAVTSDEGFYCSEVVLCGDDLDVGLEVSLGTSDSDFWYYNIDGNYDITTSN